MDGHWYKRILPMLALLALGLPSIAFGLWLGDHPDRQAIAYNRGLSLAEAGKLEEAIEAFETAASLYVNGRQSNWLVRFLLPQPDSELAALALSHEGFLLAKLKRGPAALDAWERSLAINSGDEYQSGPGLASGFGSTAWYCAEMAEGPLMPNGNPLMEGSADLCRYARMKAEADIVRFNYEVLMRSPGIPEGDQQGTGKKKKRGKPEEKKERPATMPGGKADSKDTPKDF